jgi:hypothetical protein
MSLADRSPKGPRILTIDLERLPGRLPERDIWEPRDLKYVNYIHPDTWVELPSTICFAWSWNGGKVEFAAAWNGDDLASIAWDLFHEATGICTFNGKRADEKWLKQDWAMRGMVPPSPWKSIDLFITARREFAFESKSLRHLCARLGVENKSGHYSVADARAAMAGDVKAQRRLARYNKQDVRATWAAAEALGPWIREWPHVGVYTGQERCCWRCGSEDLKQADHDAATALTSFGMLQCADCGAWTRLNFRKHNVTTRAAR